MKLLTFAVVCVLFAAVYAEVGSVQPQRCKTPATAPAKIETIINTCQDEIKLAILQEALDVLSETAQEVTNSTHGRSKRETFSKDERRIAGCLLQCVYRKVNALDDTGFPSVSGLVQLYSEGVTERGYFVAIANAVQHCLVSGHQLRLAEHNADLGGQMCDLAYHVFDCVSDKMANYCSHTEN